MASARPELPRPALMLVTHSRRPAGRAREGEEWLDDIVREASFGGANVVQLREKHLDTARLVEVGLHVRDAITDRALFFVNGNVEAAVALDAAGIHLAEDGPSVRDVRDVAGDRILISRAVHDRNGALRAEADGADLLVLGTIFETGSKPGAGALGLDALREVCAAVGIPVIAIGGIAADNAAGVMRAGAAGVAVIGAIFDADDPRAAARALRNAIDGTH